MIESSGLSLSWSYSHVSAKNRSPKTDKSPHRATISRENADGYVDIKHWFETLWKLNLRWYVWAVQREEEGYERYLALTIDLSAHKLIVYTLPMQEESCGGELSLYIQLEYDATTILIA